MTRPRPRPRLHGFTFIELMIVMAVLTIITGVLFTSLLIGRSSYVTSDAYVQVQQEARRALDVMGRELRAAQVVVDPAGGSTLDFQTALGYNLTAVAGCPADDVCWGAADQTATLHWNWTIRYRLNNGRLLREVRNGNTVDSTRVLANDVQQTTFTYDGVNKLIMIGLAVTQISRQIAGGSMPVSPGPLATRVALRN